MYGAGSGRSGARPSHSNLWIGRTAGKLSKLPGMAEAVSKELVSARLAEVREGLTLLADYL
jgi:hypothetical protein